MKIVYIAHPIGGKDKIEIKQNIAKVKDIIKRINYEQIDVIPFAHYLVDLMVLDDRIPHERVRGLKNDHVLLREGFIKEMWLYGNRISDGMFDEVLIAIEMGMPIIPKTEDTKRELNILLRLFYLATRSRYGAKKYEES